MNDWENNQENIELQNQINDLQARLNLANNSLLIQSSEVMQLEENNTKLEDQILHMSSAKETLLQDLKSSAQAYGDTEQVNTDAPLSFAVHDFMAFHNKILEDQAVFSKQAQDIEATLSKLTDQLGPLAEQATSMNVVDLAAKDLEIVALDQELCHAKESVEEMPDLQSEIEQRQEDLEMMRQTKKKLVQKSARLAARIEKHSSIEHELDYENKTVLQETVNKPQKHWYQGSISNEEPVVMNVAFIDSSSSDEKPTSQYTIPAIPKMRQESSSVCSSLHWTSDPISTIDDYVVDMSYDRENSWYINEEQKMDVIVSNDILVSEEDWNNSDFPLESLETVSEQSERITHTKSKRVHRIRSRKQQQFKMGNNICCNQEEKVNQHDISIERITTGDISEYDLGQVSNMSYLSPFMDKSSFTVFEPPAFMQSGNLNSNDQFCERNLYSMETADTSPGTFINFGSFTKTRIEGIYSSKGNILDAMSPIQDVEY